MAGLNVRLSASSLPECIVAAIIMLVCFGITMDILTRVTLSGEDPEQYVAVRIAMQQTYREYADGKYVSGKYRKEYEWGMLEACLSDYSERIQRLTLTALPVKGMKAVSFDYLIRRKQ